MDEHKISEIIVSDDSTDDTPNIVSDFSRNSKTSITLIHHNKRRGAASAWNEIFSSAKGEIVVLYDADIIPDKMTTKLLASGINEKVALCAANPSPVREKGMAARASVFNSSWLRRVRNAGLSQYTVMGRALSIRKDVARKIIIPDIIAIDLYLQCKVLELGYDVDYCDDAVVWFKPAGTMLDFASQVARAVRGHEEIKDYVKKSKISLSSSVLMKEGVKEAFKDPVGIFALMLSYLAFPAYMAKVGNEMGQAMWHVADSTKGISMDDLQH
jgi:cellulose synthase/poly-beta-1,6-N-acetylglucosamine synthase-like glycosyltransferase